MRAYNTRKKERFYFVIDQYVPAILGRFKKFNWENPNEKEIKKLVEAIIPAMFQKEFRLPEKLYPKIVRKFYSQDDKAAAKFHPSNWEISVNAHIFNQLGRLYYADRDQKTFAKLLANVAGLIYHEFRHCQQYYWAYVYACKHQDTLTKMGYTKYKAWDWFKSKAGVRSNIINMVERQSLPDAGHYYKSSLRIFFLTSYIRSLHRYGKYNEREKLRFKEELPYVKKGFGNAVGDVEKMVTEAGYFRRPIEQDAYACGWKAKEYYNKLAESAGHPKVKAK